MNCQNNQLETTKVLCFVIDQMNLDNNRELRLQVLFHLQAESIQRIKTHGDGILARNFIPKVKRNQANFQVFLIDINNSWQVCKLKNKKKKKTCYLKLNLNKKERKHSWKMHKNKGLRLWKWKQTRVLWKMKWLTKF